MKNCPDLHRRRGTGRLRGLLLALFAYLAVAAARAQSLPGSFVEPIHQFITVDVAVDATPLGGNTFVLGKYGASGGILRRYDPSGAQITWDGTTNLEMAISGMIPTALAMGAGGTNIYVIGGTKVLRLDARTGATLSSVDAANATVSLRSGYYWNGSLYVCGQFASASAQTILGRTATPRGSQAGILIRLDGNLPAGSSQALITFGNNGGAARNTANSVVVDDSGDVYVAGHLDAGSFSANGFNGNFQIEQRKASVFVGSIATVQSVLAGNNVSSTNNFSSGVVNLSSSGDPDVNYVIHATGSVDIASPGNYTFSNITDDGSWLYIDGKQVVYDDSSHGSETHSGSISLSAGLHSVDFMMFNGTGPGVAQLWYSLGSTVPFQLVPSANFANREREGYVFKFTGDLSSLTKAYFSQMHSPVSGQGGEYTELRYSQGWVYAVGFWQGTADNPVIGSGDLSTGQDIEVLKLDTGLQLKARATVKGAADNTGFSIASDDDGNVYLTGSYGPQSADFYGKNDSSQPYASRSASKASIFVAQLDSAFNYQWINQPSGTPPDFDFITSTPRVRWNSRLQRLFWSGAFGTGSLIMGQPETLQTLNGPESFVAVLDPDGKFTERVNVTVLSDYGTSGSQIKPFGGPALNTNSVKTELNTKPLIKGAQLTVSVPNYLYRNLAGQDITDLQLQGDFDAMAQTRIGCTGYSVDDNVANGTAMSYTFTITKDTIVKFNWLVEHALKIDSDFTQTSGTDATNAPGHIQGLNSLASGNPVPAVQKHWIAQNETVIASIDADVSDPDYLLKGLAVKYVVTGYEATGPANTATGTNNFIAFTGSDTRRQVPQFLMTGPASIKYRWKLKIGVQVNTTGYTSAGYPLVHVISDPGGAAPTQLDGVGTATFYFDENSSLQIGSLLNQGTVQLKGWYNGDGTVIPSTGSLTNLTSSFVVSNKTYASFAVPQLTRPARVLWDYGDRIFDETVIIGNSLAFSSVDDPAVRNILRMDLPPDHVDLTEGPSGSTGDNMAIWDPQGKKYYPLRPGKVYSYWKTSGDPAERVIIRLTFVYPSAPHYRHIANTPPVKLDPTTNDLVTFKELEYTETTTGAAVDDDGQFTATGPGKSVLLFGESSSSGRGGVVETYRVRVVETKNWNDQLPSTLNAVIGQRITSSFDTAGLKSGYLYFSKGRFNPFIYDRDKVQGPIIPVNLNPAAGPDEQLVVIWYEIRDKILWPYQPVRYNPVWPTPATGLNRIVIASRYGSESVAQDGTDQIVTPAEVIGTNSFPAETTFNPARFQQVQIYNQPDKTTPGYNPNEEHALLAPSLRHADVAPRPMAAYALRDNDLNVTNRDASYTSDPYVLVQFYDTVDQEYKMKVYNVVRTASNLNAGELSYSYDFSQEMNAGEPVVPFYPLPSVIGATPCAGTYGRDGQPQTQICFWKDHKGTPWAVSGDSFFYSYFYYPLSPDFWWPAGDNKNPGDCVAFLPDTPKYAAPFFAIDYKRNDQQPAAQAILYTTKWPDNVPILKVGETLTFPGGEYHADNPTTVVEDPDTGDISIEDTPGLPGVVGWAAGQVVFDTLNPVMNNQVVFDKYTVRLFPALEQRTVDLPISQLPDVLAPANKRTQVKDGMYVFVELPSSLQKRIFYDPIAGQLGIKGFLNDKDISDSTLTASPPAVYVLEPNVLTLAERNILDGTAPTSPFKDLAGTLFAQQMDALYDLSRNPNGLDKGNNGVPDQAYRVGLEAEVVRNSNGQPVTTTNSGIVNVQRDVTKGSEMQALGPGLALAANPAFLDPADPTQISYVTLAENNSDALGGAPVVLHLIKVDKSQRYRGAIKTILSDNVFDENIVLRHTGDFGGNADDLVFEWWYRPEDGTDALTPDRVSPPNPWKLFGDPSGNQGLGFYQLTLKGNPTAPEALLGDTLFYVRYRHKNEATDGVNWEVPQPNGERRCVLNNCQPGIPYDWAGAGNSTPQDLNQDGIPDYKPQLAEGWIKRVLNGINPYEARISDFSADAPATYSSIIGELGGRYEGPVALNPDKNVIENVGLIALYQTVLDHAKDLSIDLSTPISTPSIANALQLASTRLSDFYLLLGNEAYSDSQNPTIGYGSDSVEYGNLAPTVFAFQNQVSSLLEEELALLRGQDNNYNTPVYNRLYWNFSHAEGEAAYAMKYDISDINQDGFIDEKDAMLLYPQGHGDAWGHYLTALTMQYDLLRHPYFNWVSRSEFINVNDIVIPVDYLDERKFAQVAAAKAKAGADILNLTYRQKYVADPNGQWQGYTDTDSNRGWGVEEWARRAGQGAFFDWVTANAILPAQHPNTNYTGIQKVDRTTVQDISVVAANLTAIQTAMEQVNGGNNPLGLANGALAFDIDPSLLDGGHQPLFEQVYDRALVALNNAKATFDNANQLNNLIRQVANSETALRDQVSQEDISYRNQLIEIFGTPYAGTIGSGKAYPAGYQGPDTMLYMYVAVNNVNDSTVPQPTAAYYSNYLSEITGANADFVNGVGLISGVPNSWKERYNLTFMDADSITNSINYTDFTDPNNPPINSLDNLNLPIMASGYTFVAPAEWGIRSSPGELQNLINQMVQAQADLTTAMNDWDNAQSGFIQQLQGINAKFDYNKNIRDLMKGKLSYDSLMGALGVGFKIGARAAEEAAKTAEDALKAGADMVPTDTPIVGLAGGAGDVLAPVKGGLEAGAAAAAAVGDGFTISFETLGDANDLAKEIGDAIFDLEIDGEERDLDMIQALQELQNNAGNEASARVAVFKQIQVLTELSDQYRAKVAEGQRLMEQRAAFNKRVAAQTQSNRYQDMTFRVSRNAALEKYRSAFALAARYAYLAAKAYDYDMNLSWNDPGSPSDILADIVRQRTIGLVTDAPQVGSGGLADDLARLKANYEALKTRMGLNNPQVESTDFSLRTEMFRILDATNSDANWAQTLRNASIYKADLWQVPEFRRYCRPFSSATNGAQPGLVIPFTTMIRPNKNFFGWPLGGGDNSYDPSVYATRISSVGVCFAGYDAANLPRTPRVYLIPAGQDIMTVPTSPDLEVRVWDVVEQAIPVPYPNITANLGDPAWKPLTDSLNGSFGQMKQFSSFRAFGFDHTPLDASDLSTVSFDSRLVGRSAWNTRWLLIIPGATLNADPNHGLDLFINSVKDIKVIINSYGYSGN